MFAMINSQNDDDDDPILFKTFDNDEILKINDFNDIRDPKAGYIIIVCKFGHKSKNNAKFGEETLLFEIKNIDENKQYESAIQYKSILIFFIFNKK